MNGGFSSGIETLRRSTCSDAFAVTLSLTFADASVVLLSATCTPFSMQPDSTSPTSTIIINRIFPVMLHHCFASYVRLSGTSRCTHPSTLLENLVMVRKIKPQSAQRITESCYFYLLSPLCLSVSSVSSVVFRNPKIESIKKSPEAWSLQREILKTQSLHPHQPDNIAITCFWHIRTSYC